MRVTTRMGSPGVRRCLFFGFLTSSTRARVIYLIKTRVGRMSRRGGAGDLTPPCRCGRCASPRGPVAEGVLTGVLRRAAACIARNERLGSAPLPGVNQALREQRARSSAG